MCSLTARRASPRPFPRTPWCPRAAMRRSAASTTPSAVCRSRGRGASWCSTSASSTPACCTRAPCISTGPAPRTEAELFWGSHRVRCARRVNRPFRQSLPGAVLALAALCSGSEGSAEAPEVRAHLEVVTAGGCGSEAEITARVGRRSSRIRFVEPGPDVRRARAELRPASNELFAASLSLWTDDGRELVRRVRPARCADALEALSLVLLVSLDPDAELGEPAATSPAPDPAEAGAPEPTATGAATSAAPPSSAAPASTGKRREAPDAEAEQADGDSESEPEASGSGSRYRYRPFAGAFGSVRGGPAPGWMPGFGLVAGVIGPGFPSESALRLSVTRHFRSGFAVEAGSAEFEL